MTLKRFVIVSARVPSSANTHNGTPGIQALRMIATAVASTGITSTQNHQYSQPMLKPAHLPMAREA